MERVTVPSEVAESASVTLGARRPEPSGSGRRGRGQLARLARILPIAPAVILMLVFLVGPIVWSLYGSFTNASLSGQHAVNSDWIGFDNYAKLLGDPDFPLAVWLTVVFTIGSAVIAQNLLGLGLALVMTRASRALVTVVGTIVVAAWILPEIVAAFVCYAYFSEDGTLNQILGTLGMAGPNWLYSYPMFAVILANTWRGTAFSMLVYRAALDDVPPEITEAAVIDGAGERAGCSTSRFRSSGVP